MSKILAIPVEILDKNVFSILDPQDLLSLSLACKAMHRIVVPDHLHWVCVGVIFARPDMFHTLATNRRVASRVDDLAIVVDLSDVKGVYAYRNDPMGSPAIMDATLLTRAGLHLSNLRSLLLMVEDLHDFSGLFKNLRRGSSRLRALEINFTAPQPPVQDGSPTSSKIEDREIEAIKEMGGYRIFTWRTHNTRPQSSDLLTAVVTMLNERCLDLRSIYIEWCPVAGEAHYDGFWTRRWPQLRGFHVTHARLATDIGDFFDRHPLLKLVYLPISSLSITLSPGALPRIRHIVTCVEDIDWVLELLQPLADGSRRPIDVLGSIHAVVVGSQFSAFLDGIAGVPTLRMFQWFEDDPQISGLADVARRAPCLTELAVTISPHVAPTTLINALAPLRALRDLNLSLTPHDDDYGLETPLLDALVDERIHDALLTQLASTCSQLKTLNRWNKGEDNVWRQ